MKYRINKIGNWWLVKRPYGTLPFQACWTWDEAIAEVLKDIGGRRHA